MKQNTNFDPNNSLIVLMDNSSAFNLDFINETQVLNIKEKSLANNSYSDKKWANLIKFYLPEEIIVHPISQKMLSQMGVFPNITTYIERFELAVQLGQNLGIKAKQIDLVKASSTPLYDSEINYEMLESLGDAILKYTMVVHIISLFPNCNEDQLSSFKQLVIKNKFLIIKGFQNNLQYYIKSRVKYINEYDFPFQTFKNPYAEKQKHTFLISSSKWLADVTEALFGAVIAYEYNLEDTITFISNFLDVDTSNTIFGPKKDIFLTQDIGIDIDKYFLSSQEYQDKKIDSFKSIQDLLNIRYGISYQKMLENLQYDQQSQNCKFMPKYQQINLLQLNEEEQLNVLQSEDNGFFQELENIINYKFKNKMLLIEAFNFKRIKKSKIYNKNYEILEFLGDSLIEVIAIGNVFKLYDRNKEYVKPEILHNSKIFLVSNPFIAKLVILLGFHKLALNIDEEDQEDIQKYINKFNKSYKNIPYLLHVIHDFSTPKCLGDLWESFCGAILLDGGWQAVMEVLGPIYSIFIQQYFMFQKQSIRKPVDFVIEQGYDIKVDINKNKNKGDYFFTKCFIVDSQGNQVGDNYKEDYVQSVKKIKESVALKFLLNQFNENKSQFLEIDNEKNNEIEIELENKKEKQEIQNTEIEIEDTNQKMNQTIKNQNLIEKQVESNNIEIEQNDIQIQNNLQQNKDDSIINQEQVVLIDDKFNENNTIQENIQNNKENQQNLDKEYKLNLENEEKIQEDDKEEEYNIILGDEQENLNNLSLQQKQQEEKQENLQNKDVQQQQVVNNDEQIQNQIQQNQIINMDDQNKQEQIQEKEQNNNQLDNDQNLKNQQIDNQNDQNIVLSNEDISKNDQDNKNDQKEKDQIKEIRENNDQLNEQSSEISQNFNEKILPKNEDNQQENNENKLNQENIENDQNQENVEIQQNLIQIENKEQLENLESLDKIKNNNLNKDQNFNETIINEENQQNLQENYEIQKDLENNQIQEKQLINKNQISQENQNKQQIQENIDIDKNKSEEQNIQIQKSEDQIQNHENINYDDKIVESVEIQPVLKDQDVNQNINNNEQNNENDEIEEEFQ